jgi:hypothetical protein
MLLGAIQTGDQQVADIGLELLSSLLGRARAELLRAALLNTVCTDLIAEEFKALLAGIVRRGLHLVDSLPELGHHPAHPHASASAAPARLGEHDVVAKGAMEAAMGVVRRAGAAHPAALQEPIHASGGDQRAGDTALWACRARRLCSHQCADIPSASRFSIGTFNQIIARRSRSMPRGCRATELVADERPIRLIISILRDALARAVARNGGKLLGVFRTCRHYEVLCASMDSYVCCATVDEPPAKKSSASNLRRTGDGNVTSCVHRLPQFTRQALVN